MERFRFPSKSQFNDPISPPVVITQPLMINKVNADWNGMITMYRNKRSQIRYTNVSLWSFVAAVSNRPTAI